MTVNEKLTRFYPLSMFFPLTQLFVCTGWEASSMAGVQVLHLTFY